MPFPSWAWICHRSYLWHPCCRYRWGVHCASFSCLPHRACKCIRWWPRRAGAWRHGQWIAVRSWLSYSFPYCPRSCFLARTCKRMRTSKRSGTQYAWLAPSARAHTTCGCACNLSMRLWTAIAATGRIWWQIRVHRIAWALLPMRWGILS